MKKFVIFTFCFLLFGFLHSLGTLRVESIKELPETYTSLKERDADGNWAPALIVKTELEGLGFRNVSRPTIHSATYDKGKHEYTFYMNKSQRVVEITHSDYEPLEVRLLADFGINVKAQRVYELDLTFDKEVVLVPVMISCNQNGAKVYVDNNLVGKIENKILTANVGSGSRTVRIEKDGFATEKITGNISMQNNSFDFKLTPAMPAAVTINSNPEGAIVYIDDLKFGVTPAQSFFDAGTYPIKIEKENYETLNEQITITEPETKKTYNLTDIRASLTIKTNPKATVNFNGKEYKGGIDKLLIFPQTISFKIEQEYCEKIEKRYTLQKGENKTFELYPEDISATLTIKTYPYAQVRFNDESYKGGVTNLKIEPQVLQISVEMPKAEIMNRVITLKPKISETIEIYPEIQTGTIQVMTIPTNASIELIGDGGEHYAEIGRKTFIDVSIGVYELIVKADGYKTHTESFPLNEDDTVTKQVTLEEGSDDSDYMVFVKGGSFLMGSNDGKSDERPVHEVKLNSFFIGRYEVTQKEWKEVMGKNPSNWKSDNLPVESISWYDAIEFCNNKSEKEGLQKCYSSSDNNIKCDFNKNGYRLPTEAEWEYAACGGDKSRNYKYSGSNSINDVAWYFSNSGNMKLDVWELNSLKNNNNKAHCVGLKESNELKIYDMSGNVSEWCHDIYSIQFYTKNSVSNPQGYFNGSFRVIRGGSWFFSDDYCRITKRDKYFPDGRGNNIGFRLVRSTM